MTKINCNGLMTCRCPECEKAAAFARRGRRKNAPPSKLEKALKPFKVLSENERESSLQTIGKSQVQRDFLTQPEEG